MKIYHIKRTQHLPVTLPEAWTFFSNPENLGKITPPRMNFEILYKSAGEKMYAGQIIRYRMEVLPGIKTHWVTEITHVQEPFYFIDEQRFGPYSLWHHRHHFREVAGGVEMTDEVNYAIPLGIFGRLAHELFVGRELNRIFDFRYRILKDHFKRNKEAN